MAGSICLKGHEAGDTAERAMLLLRGAGTCKVMWVGNRAVITREKHSEMDIMRKIAKLASTH